MADLLYPRDDLDQPEQVRNTLGSFWTSVFQDKVALLTLCQGASLIYRQTATNYDEAAAALARTTVPVYHRQHWKQVVLKRSEMNRSPASALLYGAGALYGAPGTAPYNRRFNYGDTVADAYTYVFPLPAGVVKIRAIMNRIDSPTVMLQQGIDFEIDVARGALSFKADPFAGGQFAARDVYDVNGVVIDNELSAWAFEVDIDDEQVWKQVGYVLRAFAASSTWYRDFLNATWDAHAGGTTEATIRRMIAAAVGIPLVGSDDETVEVILTGPPLQVITDKAVYTYYGTAEAAVAVGDVVHKYDSMVDTLEFVRLSGQSPGDDDLPGVTLGSAFLGGGFFSSLTFMNEDVPLVYAVDGGKARVSFNVSGFTSDVELFWELVHQRGLAAGRTLANLLDTRANPVGEPTAADLPATVNPLKLVLRNLFGNHTFAVRVKTGGVNPAAPGVGNLRKLRSAIPPRMLCLLFIEVQMDPEVGMVTNDNEVASGPTAVGSEATIPPTEGVIYATEIVGHMI